MLAKLSYSIATAEPSTLGELDDVTLLRPAETHDGQNIAAGARGTIMLVHAGGKGFTVEMAEPVNALVTVGYEDVRPVSGATRNNLVALAS